MGEKGTGSPFLEVIVVPTYIMLSTLTESGAETLREHPDRLKEVNREIEAMGVKVVQQYAVLGPYDFVNIVEAPDNDTVARVSVELGARGSVRIVTLAGIPIDAFVGRLKKK
jgi:uncharacterized protein with GYD domain